jgi:hypothetical protein
MRQGRDGDLPGLVELLMAGRPPELSLMAVAAGDSRHG